MSSTTIVKNTYSSKESNKLIFFKHKVVTSYCSMLIVIANDINMKVIKSKD